jgi:hypothetical protein
MRHRKNDAGCPVCLLRRAMQPEATVEDDLSEDGRFDHYQLIRREDGALYELGHGAMGVTYKAFDTVLHHPVALKVIDARVAADRECAEEVSTRSWSPSSACNRSAITSE